MNPIGHFSWGDEERNPIDKKIIKKETSTPRGLCCTLLTPKWHRS